jgi:DNA-binding NtrC family response regulator
MAEEVIAGEMTHPALRDFVSLNPLMRQLLALVERVVPSAVSLLILGETGVGKEHLARAIHAAGPRTVQPFIPVNCGAIPENLLESELFGHEAGAFTGAIRQRRGMFALADKGTLFLDEIGEMPYHLQVKLLRALQSREIMPVGGEELQEVDVRVMAASNRDLEQEVKEGRFRRDLFYRLSVLPLTIPPLRARAEDIPLLAGRFLNHFSAAAGRHVTSMGDDTLRAFEKHHWPGNIRELMNVMERAVLVTRGHSLSMEDLPDDMSAGMPDAEGGPPDAGAGPESTGGQTPSGGRPTGARVAAPGAVVPAARKAPGDRDLVARPLCDVRKDTVAELERRYLHALLRVTGGRVGETARRAGIVPRSLYQKMRKYGLRKEDYR